MGGRISVPEKPQKIPGGTRTQGWEQQGNQKRKETEDGGGNKKGRQDAGDRSEIH